MADDVVRRGAIDIVALLLAAVQGLPVPGEGAAVGGLDVLQVPVPEKDHPVLPQGSYILRPEDSTAAGGDDTAGAPAAVGYSLALYVPEGSFPLALNDLDRKSVV